MISQAGVVTQERPSMKQKNAARVELRFHFYFERRIRGGPSEVAALGSCTNLSNQASCF